MIENEHVLINDDDFKIGTKLSCLLIGGGIGAILALLFAPKAGTELRSDIAAATRHGLDTTTQFASGLGEKANSVYEETKAKAAEIKEIIDRD